MTLPRDAAADRANGNLYQESAPAAELDLDSCVFHKLCRAEEIEDGVGKPFTVEGTHLAVYLYEDRYYACDNRCPHMGYPLSEGSIRDGVLICHWHHWEFDLKTGGCFLTSGDDVRTFPVETRDDGFLYVGIPQGEREAAQLRLIERGRRTLDQGLKDRSTFLIAKAVTALLADEGVAYDINSHHRLVDRRPNDQRNGELGRRIDQHRADTDGQAAAIGA